VLAVSAVAASVVSPVVLATNQIGHEFIGLLVGAWRTWRSCAISIEVVVRRSAGRSVGREV